jgi:hypothetical protein
MADVVAGAGNRIFASTTCCASYRILRRGQICDGLCQNPPPRKVSSRHGYKRGEWLVTYLLGDRAKLMAQLPEIRLS